MANKEEIQKMKDGIKALETEGRRISDNPAYNTPVGDELLESINKQWKAAKETLAQMLKDVK